MPAGMPLLRLTPRAPRAAQVRPHSLRRLRVGAAVRAGVGGLAFLLLAGCLPKRPEFLMRTDPVTVPMLDGTREQLTERSNELSGQLASGRLDRKARASAERELGLLRTRLERGDLQVGDQLLITVTREEVRVDTATVRDGMLVAFNALPDLSLQGLLRSEIPTRLQQHVDRFRKDFTVRVNYLTRLQVAGTVGRPGFFSISPDRPVSEVIMTAGGPAPGADLDRVTIHRNGRLIVKPSQWRESVRRGTTIAEMGLQPGDVITIDGSGPPMPTWQKVQMGLFAVGALFSVIQLLQFIYAEEP